MTPPGIYPRRQLVGAGSRPARMLVIALKIALLWVALAALVAWAFIRFTGRA